MYRLKVYLVRTGTSDCQDSVEQLMAYWNYPDKMKQDG